MPYAAMPSFEQDMNSALQQDIATPMIANPKEQTQYRDLVSRVLLAMSDPRVSKGMEEQGSNNDNFLKMARKPNLPLEMGIGMALGETLKLLYQTAKRQGTEYDPDVMLGAITNELPRAAYLMAKSGGVIKDGPRSVEEGAEPAEEISLSEAAEGNDLMTRQMMESDAGEFFAMGEDDAEGFDYDWSEEELDFVEGISKEASKHFGEYLVKAGELDQQAWQEMMTSQIQSEEESGMGDATALQGLTEDDIGRLADGQPQDPFATRGGVPAGQSGGGVAHGGGIDRGV